MYGVSWASRPGAVNVLQLGQRYMTVNLIGRTLHLCFLTSLGNPLPNDVIITHWLHAESWSPVY